MSFRNELRTWDLNMSYLISSIGFLFQEKNPRRLCLAFLNLLLFLVAKYHENFTFFDKLLGY